MGDVYKLVSDLVKDTPADGRKINLATPFARVSFSKYLSSRLYLSRDALVCLLLASSRAVPFPFLPSSPSTVLTLEG